MDKKSKTIVEGWDNVSAAYQSRYRIPADDLHFGPMCPPNSRLHLIPDVSGLDVLEVGCGGGQNIVFCARAGARRSVGIDPSASQLSFARNLATEYSVSVDFQKRTCEDLEGLDGNFDLVISIYAMMYIENLHVALKQIHSRMRAGGILVISVDHPFRLAGEWVEDDFVVRDYFGRGWQTWNFDFPEVEIRQEMHRYHRTIGDWIQSLLSAGFALTEIHEPLPPDQEHDLFGTVSKYGLNSRRNVFHASNLRRIPGTLILKGVCK